MLGGARSSHWATAGLSFSYHVMKLSLVARPYDSRRSTSPSPSRSAAWTDHGSCGVVHHLVAREADVAAGPRYRSFSNHRNLLGSLWSETARMSLSPSLFTSANRTERAPSISSTSTCLWKMISGCRSDRTPWSAPRRARPGRPGLRGQPSQSSRRAQPNRVHRMGAVSGRPAARRRLRSLSPAVGAPCAAHWPLPQNHLFCFLWKHAAAEPCVGCRGAVPRSG